MAEGTYEDECMRAELLGIDQPDYEEFMRKKKEREEAQNETLDAEHLKDAELRNEELNNTGGKLDELNNILAATQKKLDRFKVRCGSVTDLIKTKIGSISGTGETSTPPPEGTAPPSDADGGVEQVPSNDAPVVPAAVNRKSDLTKALDNHVDKLDSLLDKAENAHYAMSEQNKQMKRYL